MKHASGRPRLSLIVLHQKQEGCNVTLGGFSQVEEIDIQHLGTHEGRRYLRRVPGLCESTSMISIGISLARPYKSSSLPPSIKEALEGFIGFGKFFEAGFTDHLVSILPGEGVSNDIVINPQVGRVNMETITRFNCRQHPFDHHLEGIKSNRLFPG